MTDTANKYAEFISKQLIKEGKIDLVENEDPKITSKVAKKIGIPESDADFALSHVHTDKDKKHHTYAGGEGGDGEPVPYFTHDTSTDRTHTFVLDPEPMSASKVHKKMNEAIPGGVSKEHARAVAREHSLEHDFDHD